MIGLNDTSLLNLKKIDSFLNTLDEKDIRLLLDLAKLASVYRLGTTAEHILINTFICKKTNITLIIPNKKFYLMIYQQLILQLSYIPISI